MKAKAGRGQMRRMQCSEDTRGVKRCKEEEGKIAEQG